jgi:hypothetical protein
MTRWIWFMVHVAALVSCAREDGPGRTATGIVYGDHPAPDSGAAITTPPTARVDGSGTWSLSECYDKRNEVLEQGRNAVQRLAQCSRDSDCERVFGLEWASCWGPQCSPATYYRGSSAFEIDVRQIYNAAEFSEACEEVVVMGCDFPPSSCPIAPSAATDDPPVYTCVAGVCESE